MNMLDELAFEALDELESGAAVAVAAPNGTRAQREGSQFGAWRGWSSPIGLQAMLDGAGGMAFNRRGVRIYRISFPRRIRPAIGMTETNSIRERVRQHALVPSKGDPGIHQRIQAIPRNQWPSIAVQAGMLRRKLSIREAHMYEIWLQNNERVFDWGRIQHTRTFE